MVAVDTNVVVRFLVRDDEKQAQAVYRRLKQAEVEGEALFVPLLVLLETIWVLDSAYEKSRSDILAALEDMRRMPVFEFERDDAVEHMISDAKRCKADLADILIAHSARASNCDSGITFDKGAARLPFFERLK